MNCAVLINYVHLNAFVDRRLQKEVLIIGCLLSLDTVPHANAQINNQNRSTHVVIQKPLRSTSSQKTERFF